MKKKYVLVTGGGKRIGSSICKFLATQGWQVIIHYNNSKLEAEKTLKEIEKNNGKAFLIKADLSSTAQIEKLNRMIQLIPISKIILLLLHQRR